MPSSKKSNAFTYGFIVFGLLFSSLIFLISNAIYPMNIQNEQSADLLQKYPTVIIDAGHGGEDGGAIGINGALEKDLNLSIAKKLYDELTASGIVCVMTRNDDRLLYDKNTNYEGRKKALDMQARLEIAAKYPDAIFVSIHQNTFTEEKYSGLQVYYSTNSPLSIKLAQTVENTLKANLQPTNDRSSKADNGKIYLLRKLSCPSVLVECGFISNNKECELLCDDGYQTRLAETLSDAIIAFLNENANK